jgi:hypothetical protein
MPARPPEASWPSPGPLESSDGPGRSKCSVRQEKREIRPGPPHSTEINKASNGYCNCAYFECSNMSDKLESLDANEKAALESMLYRCRALVGRGRTS